RVGGADDDLHLGVDLPDAQGGLDAVPAGRHAHVDEGDGVRAVLPARGAHQLLPVLPLVGGVQDERLGGGARRRRAAQHHLELGRRGGLARGLGQDLPEVAVDGAVVVDDQDAPVDRRGRGRVRGGGRWIVEDEGGRSHGRSLTSTFF